MRRKGLFSMATGIALLIATLSPAAASGPLSQETIDEIHDFANSAFEELGVPGAAVLVVDADGIVYEERSD